MPARSIIERARPATFLVQALVGGWLIARVSAWSAPSMHRALTE